MINYRKHLESVGIADTRTYALAMAADNLHAALSKLDNHNLDLVMQHWPEMVEVANLYAEHNPGLRTFEIDGVVISFSQGRK